MQGVQWTSGCKRSFVSHIFFFCDNPPVLVYYTGNTVTTGEEEKEEGRIFGGVNSALLASRTASGIKKKST